MIKFIKNFFSNKSYYESKLSSLREEFIYLNKRNLDYLCNSINRMHARTNVIHEEIKQLNSKVNSYYEILNAHGVGLQSLHNEVVIFRKKISNIEKTLKDQSVMQNVMNDEFACLKKNVTFTIEDIISVIDEKLKNHFDLLNKESFISNISYDIDRRLKILENAQISIKNYSSLNNEEINKKLSNLDQTLKAQSIGLQNVYDEFKIAKEYEFKVVKEPLKKKPKKKPTIKRNKKNAK